MRLIITFSFFMICLWGNAQDVMMQGWYWDYPKTAAGESFVDTLDDQVNVLASAGITHLWLPPLSKASFGSNSNGYDPKDLYDLGEFGGPTGFGTRAKLDALITKLNTAGIAPVADVVYNHRDGGKAENNSAVEGWIENMDATKIGNGDQPFPSDRYRIVIPIGGSTGNGATTYYFKIRSASQHANFNGYGYKFYVQTNTTGYQNQPELNEVESNGGGNCGEGNNLLPLGVDMIAAIDDSNTCGIDEFAVTVSASDYNAAGDSLFVYMNNTGGYSDHYILGIWNGTQDIVDQVIYQTYTDFTDLPSGQGEMNYLNFKPNGNATNLAGDWDALWFFYDYDQNQQDTKDKLTDWTKWLWSDVGIRGLRMDAVKHFDPSFVGYLLNQLHAAGQDQTMAVGEFYDSNPSLLKGWVDAVESTMNQATKDAIDVQVFDFSLRDALAKASDDFGYDVREVFDKSIVDAVGGDAKNVVTFVNNHDFRDEFHAVDNDPLLAYAYILTNHKVGTPTIFYPDYFGIQLPHGPSDALGADINQLIAIQKNHMAGGNLDYLNNLGSPGNFTYNKGFASTSLIYQSYSGGINGDQDAIVVINYAGEELDVEFTISGGSSKVDGTVFQDITGKSLSPSVMLMNNKRMRVALPPRSYGIWVDGVITTYCQESSRIYVDQSASGLNNGLSWANAFKNMSAALKYSQNCPSVDEIWIKEGSYSTSYYNDRGESYVLGKKLKIRGGFPNAISDPVLSDVDPVANETIWSGDLNALENPIDNAFHIAKNTTLDTVFMSGLILSDGNANGAMAADQEGGGIVNNGMMVLENVVLKGNKGVGEGSALSCESGSYTEMINCTMMNNAGLSQVNVKDGAVLKVNGVVVEE